ncbi:MAG: T9SS type A sorting domain-containing protein [Vicingaceae bacterium]
MSKATLNRPFSSMVIEGITMRYVILILAFFSPFFSLGQSTATKSNAVKVKDQNGGNLELAWTGGLNAPQFSEIDLNNDNIKDLFVFDREGWRVLTFINNGTFGQVDYSYAPEYEEGFPDMQEFALLVDYNNDGKEDIFTHNGQGAILVYKNISSGGQLNFTQVAAPYLMGYYNSSTKANIYASRLDIPAITDMDGDGDIDILSFDNVSTSVNYFENFAADSGSLEDFKFHLNTGCWGNFSEDAISNQVTLNKPCPKSKSGNKHSGSTLLAFDPDGDADKDALIGDISYKTGIFLENGGNKFVADMINQTTNYPNSKAIDIQVFPAFYLLDVNNDGLKDLLVAPNATNNVENQKGVWYYENTGTSSNMQFTFRQNDFLQSEMLDFGTGAYPTFVDVNFDGLLDIVSGNSGLYNGANNQISKLWYLKNTGTASAPAFTVTDEDFGGITKYNLNTQLDIPTLNVIPSFGDITADGFPDLMLGDYNGKIHYFINRPKNGLSDLEFEEADFLGIDVGQDASPQLFDIDGDGDQDLMIGEKDGNINYYQNTGSSAIANFTLMNDSLGNVNTKPPLSYFGYSQSHFYNSQNGVELLSGSSNGKIFYYKDVRQNLPNGSFTKLESNYLGIDDGERSHITSADIDNDGFLEIVAGNTAGGLTFYETDAVVGLETIKSSHGSQLNVDITSLGEDRYQIDLLSDSHSGRIEVYGANGQLLMKNQFRHRLVLNASNWSRGMVIVSVTSDNLRFNQKLILGIK